METKEYQTKAGETAIYPGKGTLTGLSYAVLGLAGEVGEVAGKLSKVIRDNNGIVTDEIKKELAKEVGDSLWFIAATASELGADLGVIMQGNLDKLASRKARGVLAGSGDNR